MNDTALVQANNGTHRVMTRVVTDCLDIPIDEYSYSGICRSMHLVSLYECLCDMTRLRILNLLQDGPLCVCHIQDILAEPQVKVSKHLSYLKARGVVTASREGNWMIYALPEKSARPAALLAAIASFEKSDAEKAVFKRDLAKLAKTDLTCSPLPVKTIKKSGASCECKPSR